MEVPRNRIPPLFHHLLTLAVYHMCMDTQPDISQDSPEGLSEAQSNILVVKHFIERIWQQRNFADLSEHGSAVANARLFQILGGNYNQTDFIAIAIGFQKYIENIEYEMIDQITSGNKVVLEIKAMIKLHRKIEPVVVAGVMVCEVNNAKVTMGRNYFDALPIFEALGHLPQNTIDLCLSGAKMDVTI